MTKTLNYIEIKRYFTKKNIHPYDEITKVKKDAILMGFDGNPVFEQKNIEVPSFWSESAYTIAAQKYFHNKQESLAIENSIFDMVDRVAQTITKWGLNDNYFNEKSAEIFEDELTWLLINQYAAFNSPVWFNVGVEKHPQCSACFILKMEDSLDSILQTAQTEALIFKGGSGSGINFSNLRSSQENLSGGGKASGPVSFMKGFDAFAGVIKSGGKTRRAAKMVILNVDHPDIEEFIESKVKEEEKAYALIREGFDGTFDGEAYSSVFFQNANHSVRVTDEFMNAVLNDGTWDLKARTTNKTLKVVKARELWKQIASAAHKCGDPGLQFDSTVNKWHTCPNSGRINASNPCSEFMFLDESACNLASLNLLKFLDENNNFLVEKYVKAVEILITAMEIIVDNSSYPTESITKNSKKYRPLGIGYTNLGGLLMSLGLPYDSNEGRDYAALVTAIMTGAAYAQSAKISRDAKGTFESYEKNKNHFLNVIKNHIKELDTVGSFTPSYLKNEAEKLWNEAFQIGSEHGFRNSQVSLLAPTGTIGFLMDSDSTGIEPMVALVLFKQLVGGGTLKIVSQSVAPALTTLGYSENEKIEILQYLEQNGTMENAPYLKKEHLPVFDTALKSVTGTRTIHYKGHIKMMAAVQKFLSGAISKTVNLPNDVSIEEIMNIYEESWQLGLKAVAIYRDGSKGAAPLSTSPAEKSEDSKQIKIELKHPKHAKRKRLPDERLSVTHKFEVGGHEGYITVGYYEDGTPGEVFIAMAKEGSTISGLMDGFAIAISVALQHGIPLNLFCEKFMHTRFEPSGITTNPEIPSTSSLLDYVFRWLYFKHKNGKNPQIAKVTQKSPEIYNPPEKSNSFNFNTSDYSESEYDEFETFETNEDSMLLGDYETSSDAPICPECGFVMVRNGSCYKCMNCGSTSGCS